MQANICFREHLVKDTISTFLQVVLSTHKVKVSLYSKLLVSEVEDKLSEPECTDLKNKKMAYGNKNAFKPVLPAFARQNLPWQWS